MFLENQCHVHKMLEVLEERSGIQQDPGVGSKAQALANALMIKEKGRVLESEGS
jgi:hypothetical protein